MDKISFFMEECKRMGMKVLGPDVNESKLKFSVNKKGQIRFGLAAIKGVGEAAVDAMILERNQNGAFGNIFDFMRRVNLRAVNKKTVESLALAGAYDTLGIDNRAIFFWTESFGKPQYLDTLVRYGQSVQEGKDSAQNSLFGDSAEEIEVPEPPIPNAEPWHVLEALEKEKEVVGIYLSGHPLDDYRMEMQNFKFIELKQVENLRQFENGSDLKSGGIVTSVQHKISKAGKPFCSFVIEDYSGNSQQAFFSESYLKFKHFIEKGSLVYFNWKTKASYRNKGELELEVLSMGLMSDLKDKYSQITLSVDEENINNLFIDSLSNTLKAHPGKCKVKINLFAQDSMLNLTFLSSTYKVEANPEFIREIEALIGDRYRLN